MKKNKFFMIGLLALALGLSLSGCSDGGEEGGGNGGTPVTALDLTYLITAPKTGERAQNGFISNDQYIGEIVWKDADGNSPSVFAASTTYKAIVTLTVKSGYTFIGVAENAFTYYGAASVTNAVNSGVVTITFPPTAEAGGEPTAPAAVTALDLTYLITAPKTGERAQTSFISNEQYIGEIVWKDADGNSPSVFAASTVYKAIVTLTVKSGYTFTGVAENAFTYYGAANVTNAVNSGIVTITFPPTAAANVVNALDLTGLITVPKTGEYPQASLSGVQYTGVIAWKDAGGNSPAIFAASTVYTAVVTLYAETAYTFTGVGANAFTYYGATGATNAENSGVVMITFSPTAAANVPPTDTVVTALDLTGLITAPKTGEYPQTSLNGVQYTGEIVWKDAGGNSPAIFAASTVYTATVTLTAKTVYTFTGVGANAFTYYGATDVTNAENSGFVTITFPYHVYGEGSITITFKQISDITMDFPSPVLYRTGVNGTDSPLSVELIVDAPEQYDSIACEVDGGIWLYSKEGTTWAFTLSAADPAYNRIGGHSATITVWKNGVPWNKTVSFTVAN